MYLYTYIYIHMYDYILVIYVYVVYIILYTSMCKAVSRRHFSNVNQKKSKANRLELIQEDLKPFQARSAFCSAWIQAVDGLIGAVQDKGRSTRCGHGVHK